jgi:thiol-disulfide isomerase/thioredoxin
MISIPLYLAIAQWALLGALGVLVIAAFRQLGRLLNGTAKAAELGPLTGSLAVPLSYVRPGEQAPREFAPGGGQPVLIAFVDPTCPSCEQLVLTLDQLQSAGDLAALRVLLLISDPVSYLQISDAFSATGLEIGRPADPAGLEYYRVTATPLLVAVDAAGTVAAAGSAIRLAEVHRYVRACLGSMQAPAAAEAVAVNGEGTA